MHGDLGGRFDSQLYVPVGDAQHGHADVVIDADGFANVASEYANERDRLKFEAEYDALAAGTEPDYSAWTAVVVAINDQNVSASAIERVYFCLENPMSYVVINTTNPYDPANQLRHATEEAADQAARDLLSAQPAATVHTAQVLKRYTAELTVTVDETESVEPMDEA